MTEEPRLTARQESATQSLESTLRRQALYERLPIVFLIALIFGAAIWLTLSCNRLPANELKDAPLHRETVKVSRVVMIASSDGSSEIWFTLRGKETYTTIREQAWVGQRFRVAYRIGKSGRVYILRLELIPDRATAGSTLMPPVR